MKEAILRGAGPEGELLRGVVAWEKGAFGAIPGRCTRAELATAYTDAIRWAGEVTAGVADD